MAIDLYYLTSKVLNESSPFHLIFKWKFLVFLHSVTSMDIQNSTTFITQNYLIHGWLNSEMCPKQQLGLANSYKHHKELGNLLELFKGLSFVPLTLLELAFNFIITKKSLLLEQNDKIDLFINYYRSTWLYESSFFPLKIWNHFGTIGSRTNNYVEAYNFKLNTYSFCYHPNV